MRITFTMTILIGVLLCAQAEAADQALILYLPMDDGNGVVVKDLSPKGNDGEIVGGAKWADGKMGKCVDFIAGSYIEVPEIDDYDVTDAASLMAWVKTTSVSTWARIIDKSQWQDNGFDLALSQVTHAPLFEFFVNNTTSQALATTPVDDGEWHFVAGTFGAKTLSIYVDGVMEKQVKSTGDVDIKPNDFPIRIGIEANPAKGQPYTGMIDEVAILNRELSADEIQKIFESGMSVISSAVEPTRKTADTWGHIKG